MTEVASIRYGTILKALPCHPVVRQGGDGIAFVTHAMEGQDDITILWVSGDQRTPGFSGDLATRSDVGVWFEIVPDDQAAAMLPPGFVPPPDPTNDPEGAFMSIFGGLDLPRSRR